MNFVLVSPSFERWIVVWLSRTVSKADEQLMLRDKLTGVGGQHRTPSWTAGHPEIGRKETLTFDKKWLKHRKIFP